MPEQLKECPACGSDNVECLVCTINADEKQDVHFHIACESCYTSGPIADNGKIAADKWNALPRRADIERVERERDWLARQLAAQSGHSVVYWRKLAHRAVEGE